MSADKIINKIIEDANADAAKMLDEARSNAEKLCVAAGKSAADEVEALLRRAANEAAEDERRGMLNASLETRKNTLASRRALVDEAFSLTLERLCTLGDEEYAELVKKLVITACETGDEQLIVPEQHLARYQKPFVSDGGKLKHNMLSILNSALKESGKPGNLTLGEPTTKFRAGVLLCGEKSDADCSFESLVASLREQYETHIASLLFESEEHNA